jgi:ABC-type amino acid transport substrate-binding protein
LILDTSNNRAKNINRPPASASTAIASASNANKEAIVQANSVSQQLLTALRAAKPEFQGNVTPQGATLNLQAAQDLINGRIPATLVDAPEEGLLSEGYLPPWAALRARYAQIARSLPPGDNGALTVRISARSSRADTHRRGRRSYASARRRSRYVYNYGGFFGF